MITTPYRADLGLSLQLTGQADFSHPQAEDGDGVTATMAAGDSTSPATRTRSRLSWLTCT